MKEEHADDTPQISPAVDHFPRTDWLAECTAWENINRVKVRSEGKDPNKRNNSASEDTTIIAG